MKKCLFLLLLVVSAICSNAQTKCNQCNGYGKLVCTNCGGNGIVYQQVYNPYYMMYQNVPYTCPGCNGQPVIQCYNCGGIGTINNISFSGQKKIYVEVDVKKCNGHGGSLCSCKKYKGYKVAGRRYYDGQCQNFINGHICGHSPEAHGLNK